MVFNEHYRFSFPWIAISISKYYGTSIYDGIKVSKLMKKIIKQKLKMIKQKGHEIAGRQLIK